MTIDRKAELNKLLKKLRSKGRDGITDADIVLEFLEDFLANPKEFGGSNKLLEFEIVNDTNTMSRKYTISWHQQLLEVVQ